MKPKEKATEIFFEQWFKNYDLVHKKALTDANDIVDLKIVKEKNESQYWQEVKRELLSFKR